MQRLIITDDAERTALLFLADRILSRADIEDREEASIDLAGLVQAVLRDEEHYEPEPDVAPTSAGKMKTRIIDLLLQRIDELAASMETLSEKGAWDKWDVLHQRRLEVNYIYVILMNDPAIKNVAEPFT